MLRRCLVVRDDDREPAAKKVVGNFIDLREPFDRVPGSLACGHDSGVERVLDSGLECRIEIGKTANFIGRPIVSIEGLRQHDGPFR